MENWIIPNVKAKTNELFSFYAIMEWLGLESPSIHIPPELSVPLVKYRQKLNIPVWLELQTAHDILCALPY